jgi:hypothetical protein
MSSPYELSLYTVGLTIKREFSVELSEVRSKKIKNKKRMKYSTAKS